MTVFIQKGDRPMSVRQGEKRGQALLDLEMLPFEREQAVALQTPEFLAFAQQWAEDNEVNIANNIFNHALYDYRDALKRLDRYKVAEGREEVTEEQETGEYDPETGEPLTETVVVLPAIEPAEPQVEETVYDEETGEATTQMVPNPVIVKDEAERAAAQAVVDQTPEDVKNFDA